MNSRYNIKYNTTIRDTQDGNIEENVIFVKYKSEYQYFKGKYLDKIVEYVPDIEFHLWEKKITNKKHNPPLLSILIKEEDIPKRLVTLTDILCNIYNIQYYEEIKFLDREYIREVVKKSDLVICQNYISHLACVIYEIPFISVSADENTIELLKEIGIEDLRFSKCGRITYLIENWTKYRKCIQEYKNDCLKYIKLKLDIYRVNLDE